MYLSQTMSDHTDFSDYPTVFDALSLSQDPKPARWIVSNLLAVGTEIHLFGEEGGGKSRLMWQLAHSIATGVPFLDAFPVVKQGVVLFLECDMDRPEIDLMLEDADKAGLLSSDIVVPEPRVSINILHNKHDLEWLMYMDEMYSPLVTICDTVNEAGISENTNAETTDFLNNYRRVFPASGNILMNHERKAGTNLQGKVIPSNKNSYLGGAWTRKTRTSMQLISHKGKFPVTGSLRLTKTRAVPICTSVDIVQDPVHGFWKSVMTPKLALATFPYCIPSLNGHSSTGCETVTGVCRLIAETFDMKEGTVRQNYDRERTHGISYPWVTLLTRKDGQTL